MSYAKRLDCDYNSGVSVWQFVNQYRVKNNCINHGQGFPVWKVPQFVTESAKIALDENKNYYAPNTGWVPFKQQLVRKYNREFDGISFKLNESNVQITNGCCGAFDAVCEAFLNEGDEVIALEPYFDFYYYQVSHAGGVLRTVSLKLTEDSKTGNLKFTFDPNDLLGVLSPKTRILVINTPHNPTGYVMSLDEMKQISKILRDYNRINPNIIVACDEVYEHITFDGVRHYHFADLSDDMFNRTITMSSAAKTFSVTGWKMGWCVGPSEMIKSINFVTRAQSWCQATTLQAAMANILIEAEKPYKGFNNYYLWLKDFYTKKRDKVIEVIRAAKMEPIIPQGTFFILAKADNHIKKLLSYNNSLKLRVKNKPETNDDWIFCKWLMENKEINVATIPLSAFCMNDMKYNFVRFSFCVEDETMELSKKRFINVEKALNDKNNCKLSFVSKL